MRCYVEIKDDTVEVKRGVARGSGKPYEMHEQTGYLVTADERRRIVIRLRAGQSPYQPGQYEVSAESFVVSQFGDLQIGRLVLLPLSVKGGKVA